MTEVSLQARHYSAAMAVQSTFLPDLAQLKAGRFELPRETSDLLAIWPSRSIRTSPSRRVGKSNQRARSVLLEISPLPQRIPSPSQGQACSIAPRRVESTASTTLVALAERLTSKPASSFLPATRSLKLGQ